MYCGPRGLTRDRQRWVDHQLARSGVIECDQRLGVVDQHLLRHTVPGAERFLQRLQPMALLLVAKHPHHLPARVAEGQYTDVHFGAHPANLYPQLTKVSLQLFAWPGFVVHRCLTALAQRFWPRLHLSLDGAQTHPDSLLFQQFLLQPLAMLIKSPWTVEGAVRLPLIEPQVAIQRVAGHPQLRRNPPPAPTALKQLAHHQHLLRRLHRTFQVDQNP